MKKTLATLFVTTALGLGLARAIAQEVAKQDSTKNPNIEYAQYTANFEGRRSKVYDPNPNDGKPEPTIGVGHYLDRTNSRQTFAKVLPEADYDAVYSGKQELTKEQIERLFAEDISKYVDTAKKLFPKFDSYPLKLRQALVDGCYRGDLLDSPKTRRLINEGKFQEAGDEYTNRRDYREAPSKGMNGIVTRMNKNREAIKAGTQ